jgi:hypothetical protein
VSSVQAGKFNEGKLVIDEGKFYGPFEERLETGKGKQRSQHSASLLCFYLSE